jgi:hypothetical protein
MRACVLALGIVLAEPTPEEAEDLEGLRAAEEYLKSTQIINHQDGECKVNGLPHDTMFI